MTTDDVLAELEALGDPKRRAFNIKHGAGENQFGVKTGDIRKLAKRLKRDTTFALELWDTGNSDARMLAILFMKPAALSIEVLDRLVRSVQYDWVADWLNNYIVKKHPAAESTREAWMASDDPMAARAGWNLTSVRIEKDAEGLDLAALLDRLEAEMGGAPPAAQWTMNFALVNIGIHHPAHRARALAIGEALGLYRDLPVSRGCTSPFAPVWIAEMVSRQA